MNPPAPMGSVGKPGEPTSATLRAVAEGRPEAVDAWFRGEHPEVYRLCFGFLADPGAAEDAAQDAMLHLLDRLETWDTGRSYRSWRNTVVLNLCRDRMRRKGARDRAHERSGSERRERVLPDPHGDLERREVRAELQAALLALSPREREAFVLRDLDEEPTREVAETMGITQATVRSLVTLARRRLRELVGARLGIGPGGGHDG